ncbi:MAG: SufD family Fe-S cluster assembly protein [Deltaproteobacteria bacterium]|nr:SufD family Fe-S cluster assembly protein [Deltaproteobacteria bacterium]MBW2019100.1 SufD family Fe-S cluster assembly protein [Deltaproteobacteria bacterium]MBW2073509.1 SufD family Fe-S cluster assembly protein [Deltaproteobacteria bacterium]RLB80871.1 MAG: SufD family Fe-S cluster assembly protein [Deltaproteobacteria bacterium]
MRDLDEKAAQAKEKKATIGPDIDLDAYESEPVPHDYVEDLSTLSEADKKRMLLAGVDAEESERSGTYVQKDTAVLYAHSKQEGLEVMPIKEALKQYDWVEDYYWKLMAVDTDKYTARAQLDLHDGYVIRALPGTKVIYPVQACLYLEKEGLSQNVHNIIIAEEGSELHIITGCATAAHLRRGLHVGISEFYVKKDAKLSFTMIHHWAEEMMVRPRSVGRVEAGGLFLNNYICMRPVKSLQMYPTTHLVGKGAVARFYSLLVGSPGSEMDVGGRIFLKEAETRAEIVSRAITNGGNIIARGDLVGEVPRVKAHLECRGLILNGGSIHAIPELEGKVDGVEMSHEAAVGKIAQEEILYLMSRGLSEDEATATIVRGFLSVDIPGLPPQLKAEIDRAVEQSDKDMM